MNVPFREQAQAAFDVLCDDAGGNVHLPCVTHPEVVLESGLRYEDLVLGTGAVADTGKVLVVDHVGSIDGRVFDSSIARGDPFVFQLGAGQVIQGWDEGIPGMRVGGRRRLTIPPDLAYGASGAPPLIPPHATLVFDATSWESGQARLTR